MKTTLGPNDCSKHCSRLDGLPITLADIRRPARTIRPYAPRTPVFTSAALDGLSGAHLVFKAENLQKVGAFKFRGACNAVFSLSEADARRGVATHSSGNHAAALALAARLRGIPAHIVMPETAPPVKKAAVAGYGGRIVYCAPTQAAREEMLARVVAETGAVFIHPYNDPRVMAGQGTAALELLQQAPGLEIVLAPVGGGGLLSGTAVAVAGLAPGTRVMAGEPAAADDAWRSLQSGRIEPSLNPQTVADGLRTSLGELTFAVIRRLVERILTVEEEAIVAAMRLAWERLKLVIEPSSAVPLAVVLGHPEVFAGRRVGLILSGGNVDFDHLPW